MKGALLFVLLNLIFLRSMQAQVFGGNPPKSRWMEINTVNSRVIFPDGMDSLARHISSIIDALPDSDFLPHDRKRKINLVLQNQSTVSNAYVQLAPFRSEFYLNPLQNSFELGSLPWPDQLALHEYRHVQQFRHFDVGLTRVLHKIFGEEAEALANNAAIPDWFFEGDAVYHETLWSNQGRGRVSYFLNPFKAIWQAGRNYSWMKLRNGSYKDMVPGHYELGFMLVAYGYEKYGDEFWGKVTHDAAAYKNLIYPFQHAIQKYSGENFPAFREHALSYFKSHFSIQAEVDRPGGSYISDQFPILAHDTLLYVESGYDRVPSFVLRRGEKVEKIRIKSISLDEHFNYRNGKIVYAANNPDLRWGNIDYNDIRVLNLASGKEERITNKQRFFSPDFNETGDKLVVVEQLPNATSALKILDAGSGSTLRVVPNPAKYFYTYPRFYGDSVISAVRDSLGRMALAAISINSGESALLTPLTYNVLSFPLVRNDTVYFSAQSEGRDQLMFVSLNDWDIYKISDSSGQPGVYQPAVNDSIFVATHFTANGFKLTISSRKNIKMDPVDLADIQEIDLFPESKVAQNRNQSSRGLTASPYKKSFSFFNFHSLEPAADDPVYSLFLVGENILNTFRSQIGVSYDRSEKSKELNLAAVYGGLFPWIQAGVSFTADRKLFDKMNQPHQFDELQPYVGFNIPLNLSGGRNYTFLDAGSNYNWNTTFYGGDLKDSLGNISYSYLSSYIIFSHQVQSAVQHIFPRFAQTLSLSFKNAVTRYRGNQFVSSANFYFPGLLKNHSLKLNAAASIKDTSGKLNFSSGFPFSRGFVNANATDFYKVGVSYYFPVSYPDWGIANIFYLLRVRGGMFYDATFTDGKIINISRPKFRSAGAEIYLDTKWWNQIELAFGLRYSRLLDPDLMGHSGSNRWELILPVNILNR